MVGVLLLGLEERVYMTVSEMQAVIGRLQSKIDHMETEFAYLNRILLECGFSRGLGTLKATVEGMLLEGRRDGLGA